MQKFWGRESEVKKIQKKVMDFVESENGLSANYLGYWGISGVGKSELINKALRFEGLADMDFLPVIHIDCSVVGNDIIRLYDQIVKGMSEVVGNAVFENYHKCKENNRKILNEIFRNFAGAAIPDIIETAAITVLGPVGMAMKAVKYIPKTVSYASTAGMEVINDTKFTKTLEEKLLEALIKGFASITGQKFIVMMDSVEYIENEHNELPQNLFGEDGLFCRISNVLWIILGQNQNKYMEELRPLQPDEYLCDFEELIEEDDTGKKLEQIVCISGGIPYVLQMLYEMLQDASSELILDDCYWDENWNPVFARFFMNYNNQTLKLIGILSVIRNWDDKLVNNLLLYLRFHNLLKWNIEKDDFLKYQSLKVLPFVKQNGTYFSFSDSAVNFYRKILSLEEKIEIYRLSTSYIFQKYKQDDKNRNDCNEINLYLLPWLRELKENENCDSLKREMISTIYFILNHFLSFNNISEWRNVVYETVSFAILLKKPELEQKIINYLLFDANCLADTRKIEFCYWLQALIAEAEENKLCQEIKLLKSLCVLARTKSGSSDSSLPFGIQYSVDFDRKELCKSIFKQLQIMEDSCIKADYMIDCLAEYEYEHEKDVCQTEIFIRELIKAINAQGLTEDKGVENIYRFIYLFESINLVLYHHKHIMKAEIEPLFGVFSELEKDVPEVIKGEYYFQIALYRFNRNMTSHEYFIKAKEYTINNRYHKMWTERACANYFIYQEKVAEEDLEVFINSLEYILNHTNEISKWNVGVYLSVYIGILISNELYDGISETIEYMTEDIYSLGSSTRDIDWYCLNFYYFKILDYILYKMKNYPVALKWINGLIRSSDFQKKDRKYFLCRISLLKYKIDIQYLMNDDTVWDSIDQLKSCLYTAESVIGKEKT